MTGDIKLEFTITAEAVEAFFSMLGLLKERREEETRESERRERNEKEEERTKEEAKDNKENKVKENKEEENKENTITSVDSTYVSDVIDRRSYSTELISNNYSNSQTDTSVTLENNTNAIDASQPAPPTREEVIDYVAEKGYILNANRFYNYYTNLNWKTKGGTSIIDCWKSYIDGWARTEPKPKTPVQPPVVHKEPDYNRPFVPTEF